jgi:hypothetical protein
MNKSVIFLIGVLWIAATFMSIILATKRNLETRTVYKTKCIDIYMVEIPDKFHLQFSVPHKSEIDNFHIHCLENNTNALYTIPIDLCVMYKKTISEAYRTNLNEYLEEMRLEVINEKETKR